MSRRNLISSWQRNEERHKRRMWQTLNEVDALYEKLIGSDGEAIGEDFQKAIWATKCKQDIHQHNPDGIAAVFQAFMGGAGFINTVFYGKLGFENTERLFGCKSHEMVHALQMTVTPAFFAGFDNEDTRIIVCPRDMARLFDAAERDAYGKEAWLSYMAAKQGLVGRESKALNWLSYKELDALAQDSDDPREFVAKAADAVMAKWCHDKQVTPQPTSVGELNHIYGLHNFARGMHFRSAEIENGKIIFVRLEDEDLQAVGNSFGPNAIVPMDSGTLAPSCQDLIGRLNEALEIADEGALPTLSEALAAQGLSREEFLRRSRGESAENNLKTPVQNPPKPLA